MIFNLLFFIALPALGATPEWEVELVVVPTTISGTFSPFSITLDGQKLDVPVRNATGMTLNGKAIVAEKKPHAPFYVSHSERTVTFEVEEKPGSDPVTIVHELPEVSEARVEGGHLSMRFDGQIAKILLDGKAVPARDGAALFKIPSRAKWLTSGHVIELFTSRKKVARIYNLRFKKSSGRSLASAAPVDRLHLFAFQIGPIASQQRSGGGSASVHVAWRPFYSLTQDASVRLGLHIGYMPFKKAGGGTHSALEAALLFSLEVAGSTFVALGAGGQTWLEFGGAAPCAQGGIGWNFRTPTRGLLTYLDQLSLTYSSLFFSDLTHQLKLGAGFRF